MVLGAECIDDGDRNDADSAAEGKGFADAKAVGVVLLHQGCGLNYARHREERLDAGGDLLEGDRPIAL